MGGVPKASCVSHCYHGDGTASKGNLEQEESWIMVSEVSECMSDSIAFNSTVRQNITGEESGVCVCGGEAIYSMAARNQTGGEEEEELVHQVRAFAV